MDRQLRAFLGIAELGNLTAAADRLGLTQPSLTKLVKRLEIEFGAPLFDRLPRGVALTPAGERLFRRARTIEMEYRYAVEEIAALVRGERDVLRVGAGPLYHMRYIPPAFEVLVREYPETRLEVVADINSNTIPLLRTGEIDLVLGEIDYEEEMNGIDRIVMTRTETACAMRADHHLVDQPLTPAALSGQTWIVYQHDDKVHANLRRYFLERGLPPPHIAVVTSSFATGLRLVSCSDYLMIAPAGLEPVITAAGQSMRQPEDPISSFDTGVWVRQSSHGFPIVVRLIELIRDLTAS